MTACVISHNVSKESAQNLAKLLGINYHEAKHNDYTMYDTVINYGSSKPFLHHNVINKPKAVKICINKISTFERLKGKCNVVEYTTNKLQAQQWIQSYGVVVARELQEGTQGKGLTICETEEEFVNAPAKFWTKYFYHTNELRVNVYKGKILSIFDKQRDKEQRFFDFVHLKITGEHPQITEMIKAIEQNIGIDLYGMDVLVDSKNECTLLEVNSGTILHEETKKPLKKLIIPDL